MLSFFHNPFGHSRPEPEVSLASIHHQLLELQRQHAILMTDLSRLQAATATINTSIDAAVAQINKLSIPSDDQPAIDAATNALNASNDKLVTATNASLSPVPAV